jgi:hypothetical protein
MTVLDVGYYDTFRGNYKPTHCLPFVKDNVQLFLWSVQEQFRSMIANAEHYRDASVAELSKQVPPRIGAIAPSVTAIDRLKRLTSLLRLQWPWYCATCLWYPMTVCAR